MKSTVQSILKRWFQQRHFFAGVAIPLLFVFVLLNGGAINIFIVLNEGRTIATVTGAKHTYWRPGIIVVYQYQVDGRIYIGKGDPGNPPYPDGSTFEIRYSKNHPSISIAHDPLTIFGQFLVGSIFLLWADFMATRYGKKQEKTG